MGVVPRGPALLLVHVVGLDPELRFSIEGMARPTFYTELHSNNKKKSYKVTKGCSNVLNQ